jgi:hypothetical protein
MDTNTVYLAVNLPALTAARPWQSAGSLRREQIRHGRQLESSNGNRRDRCGSLLVRPDLLPQNGSVIPVKTQLDVGGEPAKGSQDFSLGRVVVEKQVAFLTLDQREYMNVLRQIPPPCFNESMRDDSWQPQSNPPAVFGTSLIPVGHSDRQELTPSGCEGYR